MNESAAAVEIILSNGEIAVVDEEDHEAALEYRWHKHNKGYACTMFGGRKSRQHLLLHQLVARRMGILGAPDHKDGNKLNCRRSNLRGATSAQNKANTGPRKTNKLGVKGVGRWPNGRYTARITVNRKQIHLGYFDTIQEASDAYFEAAKRYYGEFARR